MSLPSPVVLNPFFFKKKKTIDAESSCLGGQYFIDESLLASPKDLFLQATEILSAHFILTGCYCEPPSNPSSFPVPLHPRYHVEAEMIQAGGALKLPFPCLSITGETS